MHGLSFDAQISSGFDSDLRALGLSKSRQTGRSALRMSDASAVARPSGLWALLMLFDLAIVIVLCSVQPLFPTVSPARNARVHVDIPGGRPVVYTLSTQDCPSCASGPCSQSRVVLRTFDHALTDPLGAPPHALVLSRPSRLWRAA
ncbi:hypothetical protein FKP32DRAFT_386179 [Trametes sanguinea]|nr:hypothetical protein FKP32DRAFT_386179 [Trametes sanguinea]